MIETCFETALLIKLSINIKQFRIKYQGRSSTKDRRMLTKGSSVPSHGITVADSYVFNISTHIFGYEWVEWEHLELIECK